MPTVKEQNESIKAATKGKQEAKANGATNGATKAAAPATPKNAVRSIESPEHGGLVYVDKDGFALNKQGERDKRWRVPFEEAQNRPKGAAKAAGSTGSTKAERMEKIFGKPGEREWKIDTSKGTNGEGFANDGTTSATGAKLKKFFHIVDKDGNELVVGAGELVAFAGIRPEPKARGRKGGKGDEFSGVFSDGQPDENGETPTNQADVEAELAAMSTGDDEDDE